MWAYTSSCMWFLFTVALILPVVSPSSSSTMSFFFTTTVFHLERTWPTRPTTMMTPKSMTLPRRLKRTFMRPLLWLS
ncbi:unnamed protein product [Linum trigynum]|uniref:Secreted protein n=1 Tax=Linum trigynum TaxID=586398 RepID=A0AAV2CDH6_9ROSI